MSKSAEEIMDEHVILPSDMDITRSQILKAMESYANTKDKWISEKPEFTKDCWIVTSGSDGREIWEIKKVYSEDGWYWGWFDSYGDEYGDINDLESESYYILPEPPTVNIERE